MLPRDRRDGRLDRKGEFEPKLGKKHQTRWTGFDEKILSIYALGMTTRDIQLHLQEMYGVEVSPGLISEVTDQAMEQARAWQNRPLEPFYPIVFLDAVFVKMRHEGCVENRAGRHRTRRRERRAGHVDGAPQKAPGSG